MPRIPFLPKNERFYVLLHDGARNLVDAAEALTDLVGHYENLEMKSGHITELEHNGDTITHDIVNLLHKTFVTPIEREDIALRAQRKDVVMDYIEGAATAMRIYKIAEPTDRRREMADVVRLIVCTREKFPHSVGWNEALKRVIWRYAGVAGKPPRRKAARQRRRAARRKPA